MLEPEWPTSSAVLVETPIEELADPFTSKEEMINYLSSIYEDPFKVQNARLNYKVLNIKTTETFLTF